MKYLYLLPYHVNVLYCRYYVNNYAIATSLHNPDCPAMAGPSDETPFGEEGHTLGDTYD